MTYRRTNPSPRYIAFASPRRQLHGGTPARSSATEILREPVVSTGLLPRLSVQSQPAAVTTTTQEHDPTRGTIMTSNITGRRSRYSACAAAIATTAIIFGAAACGTETASDNGEPAAPAA